MSSLAKIGQASKAGNAAFCFVSINGKAVVDGPSISIWDTSFHRGDGVFEVMRLLPNGDIRGISHHLSRLQTSASAIGCPMPASETVTSWLKDAATTAVSSPLNTGAGSPGSLRLIATKGGQGVNNNDVSPSVIISWAALPEWPTSFRLFPLIAPWHPAGFPGWETPIKWTSYGPNVLSTQKAKEHGFSDALLLSSSRLSNSFTAPIEESHVLDGPNFAISWIKGNTLYIPDTKELGLLPSITQDLMRQLAEDELGMKVDSGVFPLSHVLEAEEVYVTSTTRGVIPIFEIGEHKFSSEIPRVTRLQNLLNELNNCK